MLLLNEELVQLWLEGEGVNSVHLLFQIRVALETYLSYFLNGCADILGVNVGLHFQLQNLWVLS